MCETLNKDHYLIEESGYFDEVWYQKKYFGSSLLEIPALEHFCIDGWKKGFSPGPDFTSDWYISEYADVKHANINPLVHFLRFGKAEGRLPKPNQSRLTELQLWQHSSGDYSYLLDTLDKQLLSMSNYERGYASWAISRWYAGNGEWDQAKRHISIFHPDKRLEGVPTHIGSVQLAFLISLNTGDFLDAKDLLKSAHKHYGLCPDWHLMKCTLNQYTNEAEDGLETLCQLYKRHKLALPYYKSHSQRLSLDNLVSRVALPLPVRQNQEQVSVILPVYNAETTLATALQSLTDQSWQYLEIIVVDDCSTDGTLDIARSFAKQDSRISVLSNHVNQGAYAARNTGLAAAKGEFITTHDADDWSHCQKIELQVKALIDNPAYKASASHWARCSSNLVFGTWRQEASWIHRNVSSLMFRREVFDELGYWDRVSVNADTEYYYRILSAYGKQAITEVMPGVPLAFGRMEPGSLTMDSKTHLRTQFGGVRKDYMDAAYDWHQQQKDKPGLFVSFNPEKRPFPAPELIDRPGRYFGDQHYPVYPGKQTVADDAKTVLLCAHAAGKNLFGAERSLLDIAKAADQNGYRLVITLPVKDLEPGHSDYIQALLEYATAVIVFEYLWWHGKRGLNSRAVQDFQVIIEAWKVDLVHVNTLVLREPLVAAKRKQIPGLVHVRELPDFDEAICEGLGAASEQIRSNTLKWADGFIVNSECTSRFINQPDRSFLLYNTVDCCDFNVPLIKKETVRFGLISSNVPKKGLHDFVELARQAEGCIGNAEFVLIGPENEHTDALGNRDTLPSNLVIAGYAETPQKALTKADVILNLSYFQESFGRTIAEAMASGRPVIAYRWGALPELIDNGVSGYLVHLGDIGGLLRRVAILAESPDLIREMGSAGKSAIIDRFGFNHFARALKDIYSQWLG